MIAPAASKREYPALWLAAPGFACLSGGLSFDLVEEVESSQVLELPLLANVAAYDMGRPFQGGYVCLLDYEDFAFSKEAKSRFFRVAKSAVVANESDLPPLTSTVGFDLRPRESDASYLAKVQRIQNDIRAGTYYQLNLLRYFGFEIEPGRQEMYRLLRERAGSYSVWLATADLSIASFSPEQFICLTPTISGLQASARPIKGTISRSDDPTEDHLLAHQLATSPKDRAELSMIIDLMRNDLGRVSELGSVKVLDSGSIESLPYVHHLVAQVSSRLRSDLTLGDFLDSVCPAGSITGAPKIEVMKAIRNLEGRDRGFFMGNLVLFDSETGYLNSSVLIRTAYARAGASSVWEYAAGSGIVLDSDPALELLEIEAKTAVLRSFASVR